MIKLEDVERGYARWAAKPHNAKWVRRIDGTPIANDICVNIFEELKTASPSPTSADAVVEACAQVADAAKDGRERLRLAAFAGKDKRAAHDFETMKFQAIELATAIRALKGTFPAAPEAKSEVAGWVVLRKRGDGIFMSAETYDEASAAAEADIHDRGYFAVSRIRCALVDPEGGV